MKANNYASLINELQARLDISQAKLAMKIGTTKLSLSRWKNGHHKPSPMEVNLLKQAVLDLGDRGKDLQQYF